ncbi:hypothetical protein SAMN05443144_1247 [Fodinibius roseus]|uniref:Uncharacterized protein n=1 Tax=Fodinibius roseus TaxID=1194090 RepID=A0A1M5INC1_9BACT|nr:hypothetical protein [Fodinibius roseus]SHG29735.1 hypothetical protein SAMN05443144_1247 [Fodinibius roseus]
MKKESFNFTNFDPLDRSEMKRLMAGSGNIYCNTGGNTWPCYHATLTECTDICADIGSCEGCAQFP